MSKDDDFESLDLRDWFAARVDQPGYVECWQAAGSPVVEMPAEWDKNDQGRAYKWWEMLALEEKLHWYATLRYMAADAMIAARKQKPQPDPRPQPDGFFYSSDYALAELGRESRHTVVNNRMEGEPGAFKVFPSEKRAREVAAALNAGQMDWDDVEDERSMS